VVDRPRIFADFNDLAGTARTAWLDTVGAGRDLKRLGLELSEGLELVLYDHDLDATGGRDDILADGVATRDSETGR
jgi:hypothetical protein